ncbi:MAG: peptide chain release factor N(5)-glutamine methyltransferase [Bradyrhizobiaceae bacterium]|nr:peptide chain release factor N(5)-glutamine methyltransferase [Bradyrhizobiaceae bacterium]
MTIADARRHLANVFRNHRIDSPDLDARLLTGYALGLDHTGLTAAAANRLSQAEVDAIAALGRRRLDHEPVARILGRKEFWSLTLTVTGAVLVPRPETELVVEAALAVIDANGGRSRPLRVVDIGTGSGALLLAVLSELPNAFGVGTDRDLSALAVARHNAASAGLAARCAFVACDHGQALSGGWDLVVGNPPYVASGEIAALAPEVRNYDPRIALDGGVDGLGSYRAIAADADRLLAPGGSLCCEIGAGQAHAVAALLRAAGLATARSARKDLAGIPRALTAQKLHEDKAFQTRKKSQKSTWIIDRERLGFG